jgi:hypothetical protein
MSFLYRLIISLQPHYIHISIPCNGCNCSKGHFVITTQKYEVLGRIQDRAWHDLEMIYIVKPGDPGLPYIRIIVSSFRLANNHKNN